MHKTTWALNKYFHLSYPKKLEVIIVSHNHQKNILLVSINKYINKLFNKKMNNKISHVIITCYLNDSGFFFLI